MKLNNIAFAAMALASSGAFAGVTPLCQTEPTTAQDMVSNCTPQVTFFAAGATAMRDAYKVAMISMFDAAKPLVYVKVMDGATPAAENKDQFAMYGYAKSDAAVAIAGKRMAIIVNTKNGTMAGVNMLLTGGKTGSLLNNVNGLEANNTIVLQTAANQTKAIPYVATVTGSYTLPTNTVQATVPMVTLANAVNVGTMTSGWGGDTVKNKIVNMAFADVRPNEGVTGQLSGKWDAVKYPYIKIGMQGFQLVANKAMYGALQTRDIAEGRIADTCVVVTSLTTGTVTPACQPTIFSAEVASLMMGKRPASLGLASDTAITLQRRVDSSGTQASAQIQFAAYANPALVKTQGAFAAVKGATLSDGAIDTSVAAGENLTVKVNGSTDSVLANIAANTSGAAIGVVTSDKGAQTSATANQLSVKLDGFSPNVSAGVSDSSAKATLIKGYPFQMEFGVLEAATGNGLPQTAVASLFKAALANPANSLKGIVYNGTAAGQSTYSKGGNNFLPLSQY